MRTQCQEKTNVDNESRAIIDMGLQAEQFLKSDLGRYLVGVADAESHAATEELKTINPMNSRKVMALQIKIQVAEAAVKWLATAIIEGQQAEHQLMTNEEEGHDD